MKPLRVVQACLPVPGHLNPTLAVAQALRARDHQVAIYSGSRARNAVEREGLPFFPFDASMDALVMRHVLPDHGQSPAASGSVERRRSLNVKAVQTAMKEMLLETIPHQVADLERATAAFEADVLVTDPILLGPVLVLKERLQIPVFVFSMLLGCLVPGPQAPPWGRGLPPPRTLASRARAWIETVLVDLFFTEFEGAASEMRKRFGLPRLRGRVSDEYGRVPLFLVASTPELDYERTDLPSSVHYVGACVWEGGAAPPALPAWLAELSPDWPLVHVTEGTIHTREPLLLRAAVEGLRDLPLHVILTTGAHRRPEELDLGPRGANIRVEQFVPHHALFPRTDVAVTTGGAGTVTTALLAGVPLVVVPTGWDLPENAERVAVSGSGLRISMYDCTSRRLRTAVERVLGDPSYRERARRLGAALRQRGGARQAALVIEQFAANGGRTITGTVGGGTA
jgi:MGT family glycosyltransferase